jgi:negative regulator of flagellin synthesis FlgM
MSTIGSVSALRAVESPRTSIIPTPAPAVPQASTILQATITPAMAPVVTSTALDVGPIPVDQDRVAMIRKAIASDSYPVLPARIGDAMIAAGMLLRMAT